MPIDPNIVQKIRDSHADAQAFVSDPQHNWQWHEVAEWGDSTLVIVGTIKLATGMQRLAVIDITDMPQVARFSRHWPVQVRAEWGATEEQIRRHNRYVLMDHADEGCDQLLAESGISLSVSIAELAIRVEPGTRQDRREIGRLQMEELERHVDAGGAIGL